MKKTILVVLALAVLLSLTATGSNRNTVKIYFTVGPRYGHEGGTQMWRCNVDGSEPELLLETTELSGVDIDSINEIVYYNQGWYKWKADLDLSAPHAFTYSFPLSDVESGTSPIDVNGAFVCYEYELAILTEFPDGGSQLVCFDGFPGIIPDPVLVGLALHVQPASAIESTTWGRLKSRFR
jgi:hypothetical protein